jgi:hypothetical protein
LQRFEAFCGGGGGAMPTGTVNTLVSGVDEGKSRALNMVTLGMFGPQPKKQIDGGRPSSLVKNRYVPKHEGKNCSSNLFWSMLPGYSSLAGRFCVPHFMAPINVHVVHHTAAKECYGGLEYRERMAGLPTGPLSLYGLVPTLMSVGVGFSLAILAPLPYFSSAVLKLRDWINTPLQQNVRNLVFNGFQPTGKTFVEGFGVSQNRKMRVSVKLGSEYDPGLGFTMLCSCAIACQVAQRTGTESAAKPGFTSAVVALGGHSLANALTTAGVKVDVNVQPISQL